MDYKELVELIERLDFLSECEKRTEYNDMNVGEELQSAVKTIVDLLNRAETAEKKLALVESERNAAIECLHKCCVENGLCYGCKHSDGFECADTEAKYFCEEGGSDMWEWSWKK